MKSHAIRANNDLNQTNKEGNYIHIQSLKISVIL